MNAKDLRIGNLISLFDTPTEVLSIWGDNDWIDNSEFPKANVSEFEPIPLTEEWLLKFGFNKNGVIYLGIDSRSSWELQITKTNEILIYDNYGNLISCLGACLYVHKLQNLYFVLTGQELEVKK